jgi:NAD(P)-dependent dehydrogenase (short-subunit alcohol dehydrogenase family)
LSVHYFKIKKNLIMSQFSGKTALIIGGTSGIGLATTQSLLADGAIVHVASRSAAKMADAPNLIKHSLDITDKSEVQDFIRTIQNWKQLDYLVNASGIFGPKPFLEHTPSDYDAYLDLNRGFFFITQAAAKKMKATGGGSIVNVGSMWAKQAVKATPSSAYSMQKAGLHSLTQHLAMELADYKIRVNAVSPAVVETPVYDSVFGNRSAATTALEGFNAFHPIGRNGQATEIASTILYLLSDATSWITGAIWDTDGGVMAGRN